MKVFPPSFCMLEVHQVIPASGSPSIFLDKCGGVTVYQQYQEYLDRCGGVTGYQQYQELG